MTDSEIRSQLSKIYAILRCKANCGSAFSCEAVNECFGISEDGSDSLFLNQQGNFVAAGSSSNSWSLSGNAGTDPSLNFLGTTDGENLIIQPSTGNVGVGSTSAPAFKFQITGNFASVDSVSDVTFANFNNQENTNFPVGADFRWTGSNIKDQNSELEVFAGTVRSSIGDLSSILFWTDNITNTYTAGADADGIFIRNGSEGANKILTSDATGVTTWVDISTVLATLDDYADDAAAALGGVAVGGAYYNTTSNAYTKRIS